MKRRMLWTALYVVSFSLFLYFIAQPNKFDWASKRFDPGTVSSDSTQKTFYKWQDSGGHWHISDVVPDGVNARPIHVDTAANILQSVSTNPDTEKKTSEPDAVITQSVPGLPFTVNPADIPKLLEQARGVQDIMNDRAQQVEFAR